MHGFSISPCLVEDILVMTLIISQHRGKWKLLFFVGVGRVQSQ